VKLLTTIVSLILIIATENRHFACSFNVTSREARFENLIQIHTGKDESKLPSYKVRKRIMITTAVSDVF
jgi:hypothetical protein